MRKKPKAKGSKRAPKPRNPHARALMESGLFRARVVEPTGPKGRYKRRPKHPADTEGEEQP